VIVNTPGYVFSGEFGFVLIEPRNDPGRYDREMLHALHEWEGRLVTNQSHDWSNAPSLAQPAMGMGGAMMGGGMGGMGKGDFRGRLRTGITRPDRQREAVNNLSLASHLTLNN
jgi:hypothetical protein